MAPLPRWSVGQADEQEPEMKNSLTIAAAACLLTLGACSKSPADNLADQVKDAADMQADAMENQADMLKAQASDIRETGKQRADAIDAANQNLVGVTPEESNAIIAGDAPAVR
jgi:hypothetical protein